MAKYLKERKFRNALIEIIKVLMFTERGATVSKLAEDLEMNRSNIHHRLRDLEAAGIVECIGQLDGKNYNGKRPRVYALSRAIRSAHPSASGTPGPACHTNTNSRYPEITHNYDQTCVQSNSDVVL